MPRAEIYLEDSEQGPQGGAAVRFVFLEGFDPKSPAHQLANILRNLLDQMVESGDLTALTPREEQGDMSAANDDLAQRQLELVAQDK
jgi:hypothetical protein